MYEPQDDTYLFVDALLADAAAIHAAPRALVMEVGPGSGTLTTFLVSRLYRKWECVTTDSAPLIAPFCFACDINPRACSATTATAAANAAGVDVDAVNADLALALLPRIEVR